MRSKLRILAVSLMLTCLYGCASPALLSTQAPTDSGFAEIAPIKPDSKSGEPGVRLLRIASQDGSRELKFDLDAEPVEGIYLSTGKYIIDALCVPADDQQVKLQAQEQPLTIKAAMYYVLDCRDTNDGPEFTLIPMSIWKPEGPKQPPWPP